MSQNTLVYFPQGGAELVVANGGKVRVESGGEIEIESGGFLNTELGALFSPEEGNGAVAGTGVTGVERAELIHKTVITITDLSITMTDATTAGCHGGQKIYDFPEGGIHIVGALCNLTTLAGEGGIADTAALVGSLGSVTVATDNATLTSTEANIVASMTGTLTDGAGVLKGVGPAAHLLLDGRATAADCFLNIAVPDAGSSANDTLTVNGTVTLFWLNLGDT